MRKITCLVLSLVLALSLAACGSGSTASTTAAAAASTGVEDGVLTIAMECAYAPYNWMQGDDSNGAVPISNVPGSYANGYDVMIGKKIAEANGWELEVIQADWDSLVPGVQTGIYDAVIAGQSMTADRMKEVDMAGPYYYATIVVLTTKDSPNDHGFGLIKMRAVAEKYGSVLDITHADGRFTVLTALKI